MSRKGRIPRPWHRATTDSWFVTLDGKQVPLGKSKREAWAEFHRIMAARGEVPQVNERITVRELADLWLLDCEHRLKPETVQHYRSRIDAFAVVHGGMAVRDLKPFHVAHWAGSKGWAQSSEHSAITIVKLCVRWGRRRGYLTSNPIEELERPGIERRQPITLAEAEAVMAVAPPLPRLAMAILLATGIRPGELCSLDSRRIDLAARRATVRGKSGQRTIPLSDVAAGILGPLVEARPNGPILVGQRGPLTVDALDAATSRARAKAQPDGSLKHVKPHCFRGLYSTLAMKSGVDSVLVSKLLGHSDPTILVKHYLGDVTPELAEAANRVAQSSGSIPRKPPDPPR
jgi:integrase